ncbi:MAG: Stp1/IreP family PP2C-type Ser/Thr phosphatase [Acidimicrobiales bacterium]|nr:Stp1/IreP family PP2C-type Ser/Thr phosphatase [Acidimicrobiales bacterium]
MTILRAGSSTHVGQVRAVNQDAPLVHPESNLFGVADGIGGHQGGEVASAMAVEIVAELATEPDLGSLIEAVRQANRRIFEKAGSDPALHGMGTTFVAIQLVDSVEGDEIAWVNVGDSRLYLFRDDDIVQLSEDHSLVEELVRDGQLTPEDARVHPQRNVVTRSLGIDVDVNVDTDRLLPFTNDRFLLCSDGLSNEVSAEQMGAVLRRLADPDEAAAELVRLANEAGGRDNITVVVVDVVDDGGRSQRASEILAAREAATAEAMALAESGDGGGQGPPGADDPFAGRTSSLPASDDDYHSETEDLFGDLDHARARRFTWRVALFVLLLLGVAGAVVLAVGWSAGKSYFVAYDGDNVAVFRGKPGGVLFFEPEVVMRTEVTRDDVQPMFSDDIENGKEFSSEAAARRYVNKVTNSAENEAPATTTTTEPTTTTTTRRGATTTTTPPPTTTVAPGGP